MPSMANVVGPIAGGQTLDRPCRFRGHLPICSKLHAKPLGVGT
jgi:hypothetical protein